MIGEVAEVVTIPIIGNGDLFSAQEVARRRSEMKISGVMIGRAAMSAPWIFRQAKHYLASNQIPDPPSASEKWEIILRHCRLAVEEWGTEEPAIRSMRARLMAYSRSMPGAKSLREKFQHVSALADVDRIAREHLKQIFEPALAA